MGLRVALDIVVVKTKIPNAPGGTEFWSFDPFYSSNRT
jgi:hypothetical protein